jgi:hypothetical protein
MDPDAIIMKRVLSNGNEEFCQGFPLNAFIYLDDSTINRFLMKLWPQSSRTPRSRKRRMIQLDLSSTINKNDFG